MASISLKNINKAFGTNRVLKNVNLDIEAGEFLTLVGPSGCGKSTLLRILAGLEAADTGDVVIANSNVNQTRPASRNLAMVFQSYALYPHLSVLDNMLTPLKLRDLSWRQRLPILGPLFSREPYQALRAQVLEIAATLKIDSLLDRKPGQLSGGQRQRVALGRAMVRKPIAFLMDEPLSNLDAALRVHMRAELSELHCSLNSTFVYVTHDQAEAMTMSTRMAVMMEGHILQLGTPDEIYRNPNDIRVAEFVGSPKMNLIYVRTDELGQIELAGVPTNHAVGHYNVSRLRVGLRPEQLVVTSSETKQSFPGMVTYRENLGADVFLHLAIEDGSQKIVVRAAPSEVSGIGANDTVYIGLTKTTPLVFNESGKRVNLLPPKAQVAKRQQMVS
ncbi:MAG: ABC transporter ATP-binding protein [Hyphomicrobiales bacterium]